MKKREKIIGYIFVIIVLFGPIVGFLLDKNHEYLKLIMTLSFSACFIFMLYVAYGAFYLNWGEEHYNFMKKLPVWGYFFKSTKQTDYIRLYKIGVILGLVGVMALLVVMSFSSKF